MASQEAGRIDAIRAQRPNSRDIGFLLECGDALQAIRIADGSDRVVFGAEIVEAFAKRLDPIGM